MKRRFSVRINAVGGAKLHSNSLRRRVILFLVDAGGSATSEQLEVAFGASLGDTISALTRLGWVEVTPE